MTPSMKAERDALKARMSKILQRVREKHSRLKASELWGDAENYKMERMLDLSKKRELVLTFWREQMKRAEEDSAANVPPELDEWIAARQAKLKALSEEAKAAASETAALVAANAADGEFASSDDMEAAAKMRELGFMAKNLLRKRNEIQHLKESLEMLRESNAEHAEEIKSEQDRKNTLQALLAKALDDAKKRIADALAKLKAMYESMIANACGKPCADLLAQIKALQAELRDLENRLNGGGTEPDPNLENMLKRLRELIQSEQAALERMEREQSTPCEVDADCSFGERCHEESNLCTLVLEGTACIHHRICGNGHLCTKKKCSPASPEEGSRCRMPWEKEMPGDAERNMTACAMGQRCSLGRCRMHTRGSACRFHSSCGYGQSCLKGRCEWLALTAGAKCATSSDCAPGTKCEKKKCTVVPSGTRCVSEIDCGNGMRCLSGRCQTTDPPEGTPCAEASDCGPGQGCVDGICSSYFEGTRCPNGDGDCGFGQTCDPHGLCHTIESGAACDGEDACGNGQHCANDAICVGEKAEGIVCKSNDQCRLGQTCSGSGICVTVGLNAPCLENNNCGNGMQCDSGHCSGSAVLNNACGADKDCSSTQVCVQGTCGDVPVEYDACTKLEKVGWKEARCGKNQRCATGLCTPTYSLSAPLGGALCKTTEDCANGQRCGAQKRCEDMFDAACSTTDDCGLNQFCNNGKCVTDGTPCENGGDCVEWQTCIGGQCSSVAEDAPCEWVADCGNKMTCDENKCRAAVRGEGSTCGEAETACSDGFVCAKDSTCAFVPVGLACDADMKCGHGQTCVSEMCMWRTPPDGSPCDDFANCGHGQRCVNSECESVEVGANCGVVGDKASLCGNGQICLENKCEDVAQGTSCETEGESAVDTCGAHQNCTFHKCIGAYHRVGLVLDGTPCTDGRECGDAQTCRLKRCLTIPPGSMCGEDIDCGNGQRCGQNSSHVCVALKLGSLCENSESTCGNNMRCVENQCMRSYGFDAMDMKLSTAPYAKCFSHLDCAFGYRCVDEHCAPVKSGASCSSNGDCGNGERCDSDSSQCEVVDERSKCRSPSDCANGQVCDRGECRGVFGRGLATDVQEGAHCAANSDCGAMQRCDRMRCRGVPDGLKCIETSMCGNGMACDGETGTCATSKESKPCKSSEMCGLSQTCLSGLCRGEYGRMLDIEMHQRMAEDWTMQDEWQRLVQARIKNLQTQVAAEMNINATVGMSTAQAVVKLREERKKLEAGRKSLEAELERRVSWASPSDGGEEWESLFAKAQDDISKLQNEITRLKRDLVECRRDKGSFVPSCESDLKFQIGELEEEVARRKAQLEVELENIRRQIAHLKKAIEECGARPDGCPPDEEQRLKLQLMTAERELERRRGATALQDKATIFECLYTHSSKRPDPTVRAAEAIALKSKSLSEACAQILGPKRGSVSPPLKKCLCSEQARMAKMRAEISAQAAESSALDAAVSRGEDIENRAEQIANNVARDMATDGGKDGASSSSSVTSDDIDRCMEEAHVDNDDLKASIRDVFAGDTANPCSLLTFSQNKVLQGLQKCLCPGA
eukprot:g1980.t1